MAKYLIIFDREACIGALACVKLAPKFYTVAKDGKVDLAGAFYNEETKKYELMIDGNDFLMNLDASEACPIQAIEIRKIE